jgi:hypothetical protein
MNNFDWKLYIDNNIDLQRNNINTKEKAIKHFVLHGMYEHRNVNFKVPHDFNWQIYVNNYSDLKNIDTKEKALEHWIIEGIFENRIYNYNLNDGNLINKIDENNKVHYDIFNWKSYLYFNINLLYLYYDNKDTLYNHYVYCCQKYNNLTYENFNYELYLHFNDVLYDKITDLKKCIWNYWNDNGYMMNNINNNNFDVNYDNFNWKLYLYFNKKILSPNINTHDALYNHYFHCCKNNPHYENITYETFNYKKYLYENYDMINNIPNLKKIIWKYWNDYGYKEKTIYINKIPLNDNYYNKIQYFVDTYNVNKNDIYNDGKIEFRYFCFKYLHLMKQKKLPEIQFDKINEAVLIEFRELPHLEFILRNNIYKLGPNWSYTIVCGNLNYQYMNDLVKNINSNIKIIKLNYDNLNQSSYSNLLSSLEFWNLFKGEKILIYQEDSCIFKSHIEDFINYDYIGAPWPKNQNDNDLCVGNGGFSLRTKKCMIDVIKKISIQNTTLNSHTLDYMKNTKQTIPPEDVYFTINMIKYNIGYVANYETASLFSTELIYNENSLGGHNFWLSNNNWKDNLHKHVINTNINKFDYLGISTPYGLKMGGGESYILNFAKYFINYKNCVIFLFVDEDEKIIKKTIERILGYSYLDYFIFFNYNEISKFMGKLDYYFSMSNGKYPTISGHAKKYCNNFYHCQFPFDTDKKNSMEYIETYKNIIVNSDFTKNKYIEFTKNIVDCNNVHILYPNCITNINNEYYEKENNSFLMMGRIFDYNPDANNKNFDIALKYFEKLNENGIDNFCVYIIGEVYSNTMLEKLKKFNIKNIYFYANATNEDKINVIKKCKYFINLVGINRDINLECYAYEHFGISIIEAINYKCIPITINGGYPSYYINNENGYIFNNENEFYDIIYNIVVNKNVIEFNDDYYVNILNKFTQMKFNETLNVMHNI